MCYNKTLGFSVKDSNMSLLLLYKCIKRSKHVQKYLKLFWSEANMFILKKLNIEAKPMLLIVWKFISKRSEHAYIKEIKYQSEAKQINIKL